MNTLKRILEDCRGVTLAEVLVAVGILTIVMTAIGTSMGQALGTERRVAGEGRAVQELRKGLGWFAEDAMMARESNLVDGAAPVPAVTFSWTDEFSGGGIPHTSSYVLMGHQLVRTYDGSAHTVARRVLSVAFSRLGRTVNAEVEVDALAGATRSLSVQALMRAAPAP